MRVWVLKPDGEATHIWKCIHHQHHRHHRHHRQVGRQHIYGKTGLWPAAGSCQISTYGDCHLMCHRISVKNMKVSVIWSQSMIWRIVAHFDDARSWHINACHRNGGSLWGRSGSIEALSDPTTALGSQSDTHDTHGDVTNISSTYGFAEWYIWWYITDIYVLACQMKLFKYLNWQGAHKSSFCAPSLPSATGRCWFVDYFWLRKHFSNLSDAKRSLAFYIS